jgi:hypothetical protein
VRALKIHLTTLTIAFAFSAKTSAQPRPASTEEGAVVRARPPRREMTVVPVSREEVQRIPGSFGDALRAIQNLPGVARAPFLSGSLIVRGSAPGDTQVLIDGTFLPAAYHFGGLGSTVATEMLDRLDFYPGNFSARFGRATGGIVDIGLRQPMREGSRTTFHLGVLDAGAFVETALTPRLSVAASARFGWVGYLSSPIVAAVTGTATFFGYWDYQAQADWRVTSRDRVRFAVYGSGDSVGVRPADGSSVGIGLGYHLLQVSWWRHLSANTDLSVALSTGWNGLTLAQKNGSARDTGNNLSLDSFPTHARVEITHSLGALGRVYVGFDGLFGVRTFSSELQSDQRFPAGTPPPVIRSASDVALVQPAAYFELALTPVASFRLRSGVRLDASGTTKTIFFSPRMTAEWAAWRDGLLKLGVGYFVQPSLDERVSIAPEQLFLASQVAASGDRPRAERAIHLGLGAEHRISPWITLSVEGFYKSVQDALVGFPSLDLLIAGEDILQASRLSYEGQGRALGLEVLLRHRQGERFFGWIAYTLMRGERRENANAPWRPFEFDQTHILTAVGSVRLGRGWELGARFRYVTGRPTGYARSLFSSLSGGSFDAGREPWLDRVPDFHQLDLRVEKRWNHAWGSVTFFFEVLNAYNRINAESVNWDNDHTRSYPAGVYLPIVPNLGVRGEL